MRNFMIYFVGTSGSGKTTIASSLERQLFKRNYRSFQFIDGDVIRKRFGGVFGYTYEERMKCNQAVRVVARYLLENGISVALAQVAAYEEMRRNVRHDFSEEFDYIEVYVKCSYKECLRRDPKGYYRKQREGKMENLNGANDVFEIPQSPEIIIDTEVSTVDEAVNNIINHLEDLGYDL